MASLLRRIAGLYGRYVLAHDRVAGRTGALRGAMHGAIHGGGRQVVGRITTLDRDGSRLHVAGHVHADRITLQDGGRQVSVDRPAGLDPARPLSFDLALPRLDTGDTAAPARLIWEGDGDGSATGEASLRFPGPARIRLGHLTGFATAILRLIPAFWGWWRTHDPRHRGTVKRGLGLDRAARFQPLDPRVLPAAPPPDPNTPDPETTGPITIILPVHNGFDLLPECLGRVQRHTDLPWHLIVIEDASTDPQVRPFLTDWAARDHAGGSVTLLTPPDNLGFIGAVNLGLEAAGVAEGTAPDHPVILLNSDALVPAGWASRLVAPLTGADADPSIASVTPMSNDAEITNAPVICARLDLPEGAVDRIDATARVLDPKAARADMPTGVGFCMALAPRFLARLPRLDPVFGRGYGEEVDWCQRAHALGGRHLGLGTLFVEHRGGTSFGAEAKAALIARNGALISQRYPTYDLDVARFIATDPLATARLALGLAWAGAVTPAARGGVPVYLAHDMGGGAEIWLQRHIAGDLAQGMPSVVLRVGGPTRWQLELHAPGADGPDGATVGAITGVASDDLEAIGRLLAILPMRRVIYSCGVGDPDPVALPGVLLDMLQPDDGLEVLFHDWLPISPSYTLLDSDGVYRGPVTAERADRAHQARRPDGRDVSVADWQAAWGALLKRADRVRVFSEDGRAQVMATWPDLDPARLEVRGHPMPGLDKLAMSTAPTKDVAASALRHGPVVLGIPGHLNRHKGAAIVAALARHIGHPDGVAGIVVLGQVDPDCPLPRSVTVHGGYRVEQIPTLAAHHGITHWLLPAIWPETFSFAIHEALATGLPVLAFDLGAQGAAVTRAAHGHAVPFDPDGDPADAILHSLRAGAGDLAFGRPG